MINQPFVIAKPQISDPEKTVVVMGAFRGGTSMAAAVLHECGVFMGHRFDRNHKSYPNYEDLDFQEWLHPQNKGCAPYVESLLETGRVCPIGIREEHMNAVAKLIEQRNAAHAKWGWKYPATTVWLLNSDLAARLRHPHFITVFRDPVAIYQREVNEGVLEVSKVRKDKRSFRYVSVQFELLIATLMKLDFPHMLVSYERVMSSESAKAEFVDGVSRFLDMSITDDVRKRAASVIRRA